jgi:hypothetical protein
MATQAHIVITGHAHGRSCTLDVTGNTLTWRAQRGMPPTPENIVTTVHDVRHARYDVLGWSYAGLALAALGALWAASESLLVGGLALAVGLALVAYRRSQPRQQLVLDLADRRLVLAVAPSSSAAARQLVARVDRALTSGEIPLTPPPLP